MRRLSIIWTVLLVVVMAAPAAATEPPALFATNTGSLSIDMSGSDNVVNGEVHTEGRLLVGGSNNAFNGYVTYNKVKLDGSGNSFPAGRDVSTGHDVPVIVDFDLYAPGGTAAVEAGADYHDMSDECADSDKVTWDVQYTAMEEGLYWVPCEVTLNGSNLTGTITIIATGSIDISGSDDALLEAHTDGLLFVTSANGSDALKSAGSNNVYDGYLVAPNGTIELSGQESSFTCGIVGKKIRVNGSDNVFNGEDCSPAPGDTGGGIIIPPPG